MGDWAVLRSQRRSPRRPLRLALLPLALTASLTACSGSDDGPSGSDAAPSGGDADPAAVVRAAADTSGTSKFALTSLTVVTGEPLEITGSGTFDYAAKEGTLDLTLPGGTIDQRVVDDTVYLALSQQPGVFYELSLADVQGTSLGGSTDPSASFASLASAKDDVEVVGEEKVRDADTTHYRGTLDVKDALASLDGPAKQVAEATIGRSGLDEVPFDAWVDDEGRLRKYVQELEVPAGPTTGGQPVQSTTTLELFDFGTEVDVEVPPASAIRDGGPLLQALRGGPPQGGPPPRPQG